MKVSLKKAFSLLDGRLSTEIEDVYEMLNYIFDENFTSNELPTAMQKLKELNPKWFADGVDFLNQIKKEENTDNFKHLMNCIDYAYSEDVIELERLSRN